MKSAIIAVLSPNTYLMAILQAIFNLAKADLSRQSNYKIMFIR